MRILVTAGATREPLDAVRFLSNVSTGATGAALADALRSRGHDIVFLHGAGSARPRETHGAEAFSTTADLAARLRSHLSTGAFDAVIMAAAVSDYRPEAVGAGKISSDAARLALTLVRTEKILPLLKSFSPRPLRVVGFKLTVGAGEAGRRLAVAAQFAAGGVDAVVHNDLGEIGSATVHPYRLYAGSAAAAPEEIKGAGALADCIERNLGGGRAAHG